MPGCLKLSRSKNNEKMGQYGEHWIKTAQVVEPNRIQLGHTVFVPFLREGTAENRLKMSDNERD